MKREELLKVAKPILFNSDMVRSILDGRKTVTRRAVKLKYENTYHEIKTDKYGTRLIEIENDVEGETFGRREDGTTWRRIRGYIEPKPPYKKEDILYVRETFCPNYFDESISGYRSGDMRGNRNAYKADYHKEIVGDVVHEPKWTPSIHMPKELARIFLNVTNIRVEQIQDIKHLRKEGIIPSESCEQCFAVCGGCDPENSPTGCDNEIETFVDLWDHTIKKSDLDRYGWDANPWVWVIEFERVIEE